MKALQILNAAAAIIGAAMAVNLAVVCLLYGVHVGQEPRLAADLPALYVLTALFAALGLAGGAAFMAHRKGWSARWLVQGTPLLPVLGILAFLAGLKR
jgi:high-affinity Fe2+/Pb2+ permease